MTPQEKAKELVDRFRGELKYGQRHWGQVHYAKQCATIAADEVLEADLPGYPSQKAQGYKTCQYWRFLHSGSTQLQFIRDNY
jgi:hypothetical protein